MANMNTPWNLESFLDSLVLELDKARETLAVKAINRPLSYTVKDLSLELQIFPTYDGEDVKFITAQPGQSGSSKISVQLASITDQQVRATSKKPPTREDVSIEAVDIDADTRKALRKVGVTSADDLKQMEQKNIDLEEIAPKKKLSYTELLNRIEKAKRDKSSRPKILSVAASADNRELVIRGENLAVDKRFEPVVVVNNTLARLKGYTATELKIALDERSMLPGNNKVVVTLDPYSLIQFNLKR